MREKDYYMNKFLLVFCILISTNLFSKDKDANRVKIGPTISSPLEYNDKLYFLATTGILYEMSKDHKSLTKLFQTKKSSVSGISIYNGVAYFGEGLHKDRNVNLYAFDLKTKKLIFSKKVKGHIEKEPILEGDILYVSLGPSGLGAFDIKSQKFIWITDRFKNNKIHVDSTPILYKDQICVGSIYEFKGLVCLNKSDGKVSFNQKLTYSSKSELGLVNDIIYGFSTEANLVNSKWNTPSTFFIIDLKNKKLIKEVELRGFNFFSPLKISEDEVFVSISTGDIITISLKNGLITYVNEFPEPFLSNPFMYNNQYCTLGAMGKLLCYKKTKAGYAMTLEKRYYETPIGRVKSNSEVFHIPSRIGFFNL